LSPGQLRKHEKMRSQILRNERDVVVYLPPGYDDQPQRSFPVLYMQDGQNLFDPTTSFVPGMDWKMKETADQMIGSGAIQPLIIVGIYNIGKGRVREYTPTRMLRIGGGRADRYARMLLKEMKPFIETQYRVLAGPAHTGIGGSSLGGLFSLYAGLHFSDVFGRIAALSPSIWWGLGWIHRYAEDVKFSQRPRIWLDAGTRESARLVPMIDRFREVLLGRGWVLGRDLQVEIIEGGEHNEAAWAKRVGPFLQFLFPAKESTV
jgi:predicted alpha/beta superfamily hydrolase